MAPVSPSGEATVAIETSTRSASVALKYGTEVRSATLTASRAHASDLLPELDRLCSELGTTPAAIQSVFVGTGPGSYTGLRVGIATALGLVRGTGAVLLGVPSGETVAYAELAPGAECAFLLDARQAQVYYARYRRGADDVEVLQPPCVMSTSEIGAKLEDDVTIFGDATVADAASLSAAQRARLVTDVIPSAARLIDLGREQLARRGPDAPESVEPLYLRPFAAKARKR